MSESVRGRLLWAILSLALPVTFGHTTACRSSSPGFLCDYQFRHEMFRPLFRRLAPFPLVLGCSRPLVGVDAESSEVVQETSHRLFFLAPTQPAPPTNSPNITHFGSLVSSMRATNPVNKIRLLRKVAYMLSLPVLISMSRYEIGWSARCAFANLCIGRIYRMLSTVLSSRLEFFISSIRYALVLVALFVCLMSAVLCLKCGLPFFVAVLLLSHSAYWLPTQNTTLHGGQSRWCSAKQEKENIDKKSGRSPPSPPPPRCCWYDREKTNK